MADTQPITAHRYLRVEDLRRLRHVAFASRRPVEGHYVGRHRSRQRGYGVEFNDYREYTPGDDVGAMDWKVFGRSDRLYVKRFEHESDMAVTLVVDGSASMGYAGMPAATGAPAAGAWLKGMGLGQRKKRADTRVFRKYDQACHLAAAIAFLTVKQGDRAGLAVAREGAAQPLSPRSGTPHLHHLLGAMEAAAPGGGAALAGTLDTLARRTPRRGLLIVLSDLFEDRDAVMKQLAAFRARGTDVIVFHVLHPDELRLPDLDDAVFVDSESGRRVTMNVRDVRERYHETLHVFLDGWAAGCKRAGFDYNLVSTATPYSTALERYLLTRASLR